MSAGEVAWVLNLMSTFGLVGLIWTVQLVHYPAFRFVDAERFREFEVFHQQRISRVVMPMMLVELVSGVTLVMTRPEFFPLWAAAVGAGLIGVIWASTFLVQVPLHGRLSEGFDGDVAKTLADSNWIRTAGWSLRGILVLVFLGVSA